MKVDVVALKRYFGKTKAVDDISFSFETGHVFGFVGPNGSGKTTTMRILATLDNPTAGDAFIDGYSVKDYPEIARRAIGFVPDSLPTHEDITVHEYLDFYARAYGLKAFARREALENVEEFTGVIPLRDKLLRDLSKGMKQRVSVGRALIHDPDVLIMDEPAAGLDPRARIELRELLKLLGEQDKAILISSHILTELTEICNGAVIIERGRILRTGTIEALLASPRQTIRIVIRPLSEPGALQRRLLERPGVLEAVLTKNEVAVEIPGGEEAAAALLSELVTQGIRIAEFRPLRADLEDIFMQVTNGDVQ